MKAVVLWFALVVGLVGCGLETGGPQPDPPPDATGTGGSGGGGGGGTGDGGSSRGPIAESDPDVVAGFAPWVQSCIGWIRTDCQKSVECGIGPASDCWDDDFELRAGCVQMVQEDNCQAATPDSFDRCADDTEAETCQEYCDSTFCFNFCFFSCAD